MEFKTKVDSLDENIKKTLDEHSLNVLKIREYMEERERARTSGEFGRSDHLRDQLVKQFDIEIIDQKNGPSGWKFKDGRSNKISPDVKLPECLRTIKKRPREAEENQTPAPTSAEKKAKLNKSEKSEKISAKKTPEPEKKKKTTPTSAEQERNKSLMSNIVAPTSSTVRNVHGIKIEDTKLGPGRAAKLGDRLKMMYVGRLQSNNKVFDASKKPFVFRLGRGEVIAGWDIGCQGLKIGGKRKLTIPPEKGYGKAGSPPVIPGGATLIFDIELVDIQ